MTTNLKVLALAALAFALPGCPNESGNQQAGGDQNGGGADPNGFASEAAARPDPRATPRGVVPDVGAGYPTAQFLPRGGDGDLTLAQIKNMRDSRITYNQRLTMMDNVPPEERTAALADLRYWQDLYNWKVAREFPR